MRRASRLLILLVLAGCAAQRPSPGTPAPSQGPAATVPPAPLAAASSPSDVERLRQQGVQASRLFRDGQYAQADALLASIIADPGFPALPTTLQHVALMLGGNLAMQMREPKRGLALLQRACNMTEATGEDWFTCLRAADVVGDERDMVASLAILAVRWPDQLPRLERTRDLDYAMRSLRKLGTDADRYAVLVSLFSAHLSRQHDEESEWWRDLALLQLARGEREAAARTLLRVNAAYVAVSIEADLRFDSIRDLRDTWSVAAITRRALASASRRAQDDPGELEPMTRLAHLLRDSLQFAAELQVTDAAIERIEVAGPQAYSDYDREYVWVLNERASALYGLGRWEAALIQLQAASELPEGGTPNLSQLINLAAMYAELERPIDSRAALAQVEPRPATPFGDMQKRLVALFAGVQLHDGKAVSQALTFMREHRDDAPGAVQQALLVSGHDNECAQLLISRLADPRSRSDALLAVQEYDAPVLPPWLAEKHRRWKSLIARRDVQAAIARVGRVGHYSLDQPGY